MTPIDSPETPAEFQYNMAHTATHEIVDRTFRAIQTRFRCLDDTKGYLQVFCSPLFCHEQENRTIATTNTLQCVVLVCISFPNRKQFSHITPIC